MKGTGYIALQFRPNPHQIGKDTKKIRNLVVKKQKFEENLGQRQKLSHCGDNSTSIWKNVKNILHWVGNNSPKQLFYEGRLIRKSQELASTQNNFFLDKIHKIRENLPYSSTNPIAKLRSLMSGRTCSFSFSSVGSSHSDARLVAPTN